MVVKPYLYNMSRVNNDRCVMLGKQYVKICTDFFLQDSPLYVFTIVTQSHRVYFSKIVFANCDIHFQLVYVDL